MKKKSTKFSDKELRLIKKLYVSGISLKELGRRYNCCGKTIKQGLCSIHIKTRSRPEAGKLWERSPPKKYICSTCGGPCDRHSEVCKKCYLKKDHTGKNNSYWSGGKPLCKNCNSILSSYSNKTSLCKKCLAKLSGAKHWNWRGGSMQRNCNSLRYRKWRITIFKRDKFTCHFCKTTGGKLQAHHKVPWAANESLRYSIANGITLCIKCHQFLHWAAPMYCCTNC